MPTNKPLLTVAIRTTQATALLDAIDSGSGAGKLKTYAAGSTPSAVADALPGDAVLLAEHTLADPCGTVTDGVLTFSAIATVNAAASGTARFARLCDSDGDAHAQLDVGITGSGAGLILNDVALIQNGPIAITAMTYAP